MSKRYFKLHTQLRSGAEVAYERVHQEMSLEVKDALRRAGFNKWLIFRDGRDLFHIVECTDYPGALKRFFDDPVGRRWQEEMALLLEPNDEGSIRSPMSLVWEL